VHEGEDERLAAGRRHERGGEPEAEVGGARLRGVRVRVRVRIRVRVRVRVRVRHASAALRSNQPRSGSSSLSETKAWKAAST